MAVMNGKRRVLLMAIALAAILLPAFVSAQLSKDGKGPANAFNYTESQVSNLTLGCASRFECTQANSKDFFFYNCSYDLKSAQCQCFQGNFSSCNASRSSLGAKQVAALGKGAFSVMGSAKAVLAKIVFMFSSLPLLAKLAAAVIVAAVIIAVLMRMRDNASNNFRKAKSLHQEASELHDNGEEEKAKLLFEKANYLRERADEQQKGPG